MIKVLKWMGPCPKTVLALNKATDGLFPKEFVLCSSLFVINYFLNRWILSGLHKRLSSIIFRHCVGWILLLCFWLLSTGGHIRTTSYLYWEQWSWSSQECSSVLLLNDLLRMWFLSCSMSSGFCCCICWANCCPLQEKGRINWVGLSKSQNEYSCKMNCREFFL